MCKSGIRLLPWHSNEWSLPYIAQYIDQYIAIEPRDKNHYKLWQKCYGNKKSSVLILVFSTENGITSNFSHQISLRQKIWSLTYQKQKIYYQCSFCLIITTTLVGLLCISKIWKCYNIQILKFLTNFGIIEVWLLQELQIHFHLSATINTISSWINMSKEMAVL